MTDDVKVYAYGMCYCSACVPHDATPAEVAEMVNREHPTGVTPWTIADDPFASGQPNPCPCEDNVGRLHYLLVC